MLADLRAEILKRQLSNSENFDRAILTLSSAVLGLSLTFIKNVIAIDSAVSTWFLFASWILMVISIVVTLLSFHLSQRGLDIQLERAEDYYLRHDEGSRDLPNLPARLTEYVTYASSFSFILGIVSLVIFAISNTTHEGNQVSNNQDHERPAAADFYKAAKVPQIQSVPDSPNVRDGANVPSIQEVHPAQETPSSPQPSTPTPDVDDN